MGTFRAIMAVSRNGIIGNQGKLPWAPIEQDLRFFQYRTLGHCVLMGRKTFDSLPRGEPLPHRTNILVTHKRTLWASEPERLSVRYTVEDAIACAEQCMSQLACDTYVIGGKQIYEAMLPRIQEFLVTHLDMDATGETDARGILQTIGTWEPETMLALHAPETRQRMGRIVRYVRQGLG